MASDSAAVSLGQVFEKAEVPQPLATYITDTCMVTTVDDFLSYVVRGKFEEELKDVVVERFPVVEAAENVTAFTIQQQRLYITKLRAAYRLAVEAEAQANAAKERNQADKVETDMEKPLGPELEQSLAERWAALHNWQPIKSMKAAPKFKNRVFREFRVGATTLHPVEKAVTLRQSKRPQEPERLPVGGGALVYETVRPATRDVNTPLGYIASLRLIMGTYAYCGSHQVTSKKDPTKEVVFFPWEVALGYADEAMEKVLEIPIFEDRKLGKSAF